MIDTQMSLLPEQEIRLSYQPNLSIGAIISDGLAPQPGRSLVESIGKIGVIEPIIVRLNADGFYEIIDGRRRATAAGINHQQTVPALVAHDADGMTAAALLLVLNEQRRSNPFAELDAIERLLEAGASIQEISKATGLNAGAIRVRLKLGALHPELRTLANAGEIPVSVAEHAATLSQQDQSELLQQHYDGAKITAKSVSDMRRVRVTEHAAVLPGELWSGPDLKPEWLTPKMPDPAAVVAALEEARADERERIAKWIETRPGATSKPTSVALASLIRQGAHLKLDDAELS